MAAITATPIDAPARPQLWRWRRAGAVLTRAARKGTQMVSAARHHDWSPALTISGLTAIDTAAWTSYGRGAAWLATGISILIFDWSRDR